MSAQFHQQPLQTIKAHPLTPHIGAEITGVDLRDALSDEVISEIRSAVLKYKMIAFREQDISTGQHVAFARRLGKPDIFPLAPHDPTYPEVLHLKSGPSSDPHKGAADVWHTDGSWRAEPSWGTVLRSRIVPEAGGDTLFADMSAAFKGLSPALKAWVGTLTGVHSMAVGVAGRTNQARDQINSSHPPQEHPLVVTHPETGEQLLYANSAFLSHIKDLSPVESEWLVHHLCAQALVPEYQCRLRWRPNTLAIWDNWSCQHYGAYDYFPSVREMERVAIAGKVAFSARR